MLKLKTSLSVPHQNMRPSREGSSQSQPLLHPLLSPVTAWVLIVGLLNLKAYCHLVVLGVYVFASVFSRSVALMGFVKLCLESLKSAHHTCSPRTEQLKENLDL